MKSLSCVLMLWVLLILTGCGPAAASNYVPTVDTVTSAADITIDETAQNIHITQAGSTVHGEILEDCEVGFEKLDFKYSFKSDEELTLGDQSLQFVRSLATTGGFSAVDSRLFAVWKTPTHTKSQLSVSIEVEIHPDQIIYRTTCKR